MGLMGWMEPKGIKETMDSKDNRVIRYSNEQFITTDSTFDF